MKRKITKEDIVAMITELDTRCAKWDSGKMDRAINNGFGELCTVTSPFVNQVNEQLKDYYDLGETRFDINLSSDATNIYDMYLMRPSDTTEIWDHDEAKLRDENVIWNDNVNLGIVHVDLTKAANYGVSFETAVVKYFYIPTADFDELYISQEIYLALESAIGSSVYDVLHDVEKSGQKRTQFQRQAAAILEPYPVDYSDPGKPSMFPPGT